MKKYLEDLEKELKKLKVKEEDVKEILEDHREMLFEAQQDGLTDDELEIKFGDPKKIAKELKQDSYNDDFSFDENPVFEEEELEGYELFETYPIIDMLQNVDIKLVNEELVYFPYDGMSIQIYAKKLKHPENYIIKFENGTLSLKRRKKGSFNMFTSKNSADFGIKVPFEQYLKTFSIDSISGDCKVDNINTKELIVKTTSGDFEISNVISDKSSCSTVSGDIEISNMKGKDLNISLVSGDCDIENINLANDLQINTVSGDIDINNFKSESISFRSVSGDLEGREVYPNSLTLKSVSGDVEITNDNKEHTIEIKAKKTLSGNVTIN